MPQQLTRNGIAAGKNDRENEGGTTVIYDGYTLGTYDPDEDGTGNDFDPENVYGFGRTNTVHVHVADGSAYRAAYDYVEEAIRVFSLDGTGEVGNATELDIDLRVEVRGMGP